MHQERLVEVRRRELTMQGTIKFWKDPGGWGGAQRVFFQTMLLANLGPENLVFLASRRLLPLCFHRTPESVHQVDHIVLRARRRGRSYRHARVLALEHFYHR